MSELDRLQKRLDSIAAMLGDDWDVGTLKEDHYSGFTLDLDWHGPELDAGAEEQPAGATLPSADPMTEYLARSYSVVSTGVPGFLKLEDIAAVDDLCDILEENGPTFPNGDVILSAYHHIHYSAWQDAIYSYVEDCRPEDLPATGDGIPYWRDDLQWLADLFPTVDVYTTIGQADIYGRYSDIPLPTNGDEEPILGAILVASLGDTGGESEVELEYFTEGLTALEGLLLRNLLCTAKSGDYAYVRRDLMGGVWAVYSSDDPDDDPHAILADIIDQCGDDMKGYYNCSWQWSRQQELGGDWLTVVENDWTER